MTKPCTLCEGKCCLDYDTGYHVAHMGAECYMHDCDDCDDGQVPKSDPRDEKIAALSAAIAAWPEATHNSGCAPMWDGGPCDCGTAALNARRKEARRVAGLEAAP